MSHLWQQAEQEKGPEVLIAENRFYPEKHQITTLLLAFGHTGALQILAYFVNFNISSPSKEGLGWRIQLIV